MIPVLIVFVAGVSLGTLFYTSALYELTDAPYALLMPDALFQKTFLGASLWGVLICLGVWLGYSRVAAALRRKRFAEVRRGDAWSFLPFVSLLIIFLVAQGLRRPEVLAYLQHGVVFSLGSFFALKVFLWTNGLEEKRKIDWARASPWILAAMIMVFTATFSILGAFQYGALNVPYGDSGYFEEQLWRTMHGEFLVQSMHKDIFLGKHIQLVHLLLVPVYIIFPHLLTLVVLQNLAVAAGAVAVYLLARDKLQKPAVALAFALAYLLYPPLQIANQDMAFNIFRPILFAVPFLLFAFYFLERERYGLFFLFALLTLITKEEFGLILAFMGIYIFLAKRKKRLGASVFALGIIWFLVAFFWVIPYFHQAAAGARQVSHVVTYYENFGKDWEEVKETVLKRPLFVLGYLFSHDGIKKINFLLYLFVPFAFLGILAPGILAIGLPTFALSFLASRDALYDIKFYYYTPLIPFFLISAIYGSRRLRNFLIGKLPRFFSQASFLRLLTALIIFTALFSNILQSKSPISVLFHHPRSSFYWRNTYVSKPRAHHLAEIKALLPADARLATTNFLGPHFTHYQRDYVFPKYPADEVDYLVIDTTERWQPAGAGEATKRLLASPAYEKIFHKDGILVFRRKFHPQEEPNKKETR
jgi:uncharacterized membrane protein